MGRLIFYIVMTSYLRRGPRDLKLSGWDVLRLFAEWVFCPAYRTANDYSGSFYTGAYSFGRKMYVLCPNHLFKYKSLRLYQLLINRLSKAQQWPLQMLNGHGPMNHTQGNNFKLC